MLQEKRRFRNDTYDGRNISSMKESFAVETRICCFLVVPITLTIKIIVFVRVHMATFDRAHILHTFMTLGPRRHNSPRSLYPSSVIKQTSVLYNGQQNIGIRKNKKEKGNGSKHLPLPSSDIIFASKFGKSFPIEPGWIFD